MSVANENVSSIHSLPDWEQDNLRSGMRAPYLRQVARGTKIFRAASKTSWKADPEAGGWWFNQKAFNKIMAFAVQNDKSCGSLGFAIRRAMAVLVGWNDCDLLVEGRLKQSVGLFIGRGHKQREITNAGKTVVYKGWTNVDQWYIPGLTEQVVKGEEKKYQQLNSFGRSVIDVYRICPIDSYRPYKTAG